MCIEIRVERVVVFNAEISLVKRVSLCAKTLAALADVAAGAA